MFLRENVMANLRIRDDRLKAMDFLSFVKSSLIRVSIIDCLIRLRLFLSERISMIFVLPFVVILTFLLRREEGRRRLPNFD